jgi:hypothetical protein
VPAVPFIGHAGLFPPFANAAVLKLVEANEAMTSTAIVPAMKVAVIYFLDNSMATSDYNNFWEKYRILSKPRGFFENLLSR